MHKDDYDKIQHVGKAEDVAPEPLLSVKEVQALAWELPDVLHGKMPLDKLEEMLSILQGSSTRKYRRNNLMMRDTSINICVC
jgi:hypothetical protein